MDEYVKIKKSYLYDRSKELHKQLKASQDIGDEIKTKILNYQISELKLILMVASDIEESINTYELNEYGTLVFKHKTNKHLFLEKPYRWKDTVFLIDESDEGREIIDSYTFSKYDLSAWTLMTKKEFKKVKHYYKEIYEKS